MGNVTGKSGDSLVQAFRTEAETVNAKVYIHHEEMGLIREIASYCSRNAIHILPCVLSEEGTWAEVMEGLRLSGIGLVTDDMDVLEKQRAAISAADYGIADTGSLLFFETRIIEVRSGTIPDHHLVLLDAGNIRPDEQSLKSEIDTFIIENLNYGRPCRVSFITGPSRTADIERKLTIGVHGPRDLAIFILDKGDQ